MKIFYCRVGWMNNYKGSKEERPVGGGSYNTDNIGHEVYNFVDYDGSYYGFVQAKDSIHVEKLGADNNKAEGVLVVWVSKKPSGGQFIVGWYKNATVFRTVQDVPNYVINTRTLKDHNFYNVFSKDATLVETKRRNFKIEGMGHVNFWYGNKEVNARVAEYVENYDNEVDIRICEVEKNTEKLEGKEKETVVKQRINQDEFRKCLLRVFNKCAICNVSYKKILIASHIKPWSKSNKTEKLDVNNGLLLCPNHDKLFDTGLISFDETGKIMISDSLDPNNRIFLNVHESMNIDITEENNEYVKYHRERIFINREDE